MIRFKTIREGQRVAVWNPRGEVRLVDGPHRLLLWNQRVEPLERYSAASHQYLAVRFLDGRLEHLRGPLELWFDPVRHEQVTVHQAIAIDAHEALVVYARQDDDSVQRRVLYGPLQFVPAANEWLHEFQWHGADPRQPDRKIPRALKFTKLRVIPDQMYVDAQDVRTADDALVVVKLMIFFALDDIERMLDQTHDPVADFVNAVTADIIDFASGHSFEEFKENSHRLNDVDQYANLMGRAERIGYRIHKVVYRGYTASEKLQAMHDSAIEARTGLKLEAETERQQQELADLKLAREAEREQRQREMERERAEHQRKLQHLEHEAKLGRREAEQRQSLTHQRGRRELRSEYRRKEYDDKVQFLGALQGLQIDLTRYLVAQYQHPDRLVRVEGNGRQQVHVHDN